MLEHKQFCLEGINEVQNAVGVKQRRSHLGQAAGQASWEGGGGREHNPHLKGRVVRNQLERQLHGAEWEGDAAFSCPGGRL